MALFRLAIIVNKRFEADPLMGALVNAESRPPVINDIGTLTWPRKPQTSMNDVDFKPRAQFLFGADRALLVEVWCIQDLMDPAVSFSNTAEKARILPMIISYGNPPDFVVAVGTAGFPDKKVSKNGCVVVGSRVFVHNPYTDKPNPASNWNDPSRMDSIVQSDLGFQFVESLRLDSKFRSSIQVRMIPIRRQPGDSLELLLDGQFTAVSEVNVTDYHDYGKFDEQSILLAQNAGGDPVGSIETTHGLIRMLTRAPFVFVSGITDRLGHFDEEVTISPETAYTQNFSAAHNAGLVAMWMIAVLEAFLKQAKSS
jgi:hypothetical protein